MRNPRKQRTVYEVSEILARRYGGGSDLYESFLDHEAIFTLETLISYGPDETDAASWQEYADAAGDLDLEACRHGAYESFLDTCRRLGIDGSKAWDTFAEASGYYGTDESVADMYERVNDSAASYEMDGRAALKALRGRT